MLLFSEIFSPKKQQILGRTLPCNFIKKETLAQVFLCEFCEIFKKTFCRRSALVAASVTQKLAHNGCVKHAGTKKFCPCRKKYGLEKSHSLAYFTLCMSWLAEIVKSTSCLVKCCFFVSAIVGLKLSEKGLDFFFNSFFCLFCSGWAT